MTTTAAAVVEMALAPAVSESRWRRGDGGDDDCGGGGDVDVDIGGPGSLAYGAIGWLLGSWQRLKQPVQVSRAKRPHFVTLTQSTFKT